MEIKVNSYKKQSTLISSIIFFIIGCVLLTNPEIFITTISKVVGIILLLIGSLFIVFMIFGKNEDDSAISKLITGICFISLSVLFLFFSTTIERIIRLIVGFWILFCGINRLIIALRIANKDKRFFSLIIISLLLIAVGVYTMIIGDVVLSTIGLILMIYSAIDIIGYIFYAKETDEEVEINKDVTLITTQEEPETEVIKKKKKKTKKLKDVKDVEEKEKE